VHGVGLFLLALGAVSLLGAVVAAAAGLVALAVTLGTLCTLLAAVGAAVLVASRRGPRDVRGTATIGAVVMAGTDGGHGVEVVLDLRVKLRGRAPYATTIATVVPEAALERYRPGATVPVSVGRGRPASVTVDWGGEAP
jgi:hypothetical protein